MPIDLTPSYSIAELRNSKSWSKAARFVQESDYQRIRTALEAITWVVGHNSCTDGKTPNGFAVALDRARAALGDPDPAMPADPAAKLLDACLAAIKGEPGEWPQPHPELLTHCAAAAMTMRDMGSRLKAIADGKYVEGEERQMAQSALDQLTEGRTIWNSDGTDGPALICVPTDEDLRGLPAEIVDLDTETYDAMNTPPSQPRKKSEEKS